VIQWEAFNSTLDFLASRTARNKFVFIINYPVCSILLTSTRHTKTPAPTSFLNSSVKYFTIWSMFLLECLAGISNSTNPKPKWSSLQVCLFSFNVNCGLPGIHTKA
jgi:hypothetical protein